MTPIAVLTRLVKWFADRDETVQTSVLGILSGDLVRRRRRVTVHTNRVVFRLEMESLPKKRLDAFCDTRGMAHIVVLSRLVKWVAAQEEKIQASVLEPLSEEIMGDVSRALHLRLVAAASARKLAAGAHLRRLGTPLRSRWTPRRRPAGPVP
jgi:hypothetical protein